MAPGTDPVAFGQLMRVDMTVNADGSVKVEDGGIPMEASLVWSGDKPGLVVSTIAGLPAERTTTAKEHRVGLTLAKDGTLSYTNPDTLLVNGPVILTRDAQP